jgi:hypothetical protein
LAMTTELACCFSNLTLNVFTPLINKKQSNGGNPIPVALIKK